LGPKTDITREFWKDGGIEKLKKTLSSLKGHRSRHKTRFDKNLHYSDIRRTEQLKIALLEQNDKVISHLEKMGEADENESLQAAVSKELAEAMAIDEAVNEEFVVYCQRIHESLAQGNQINRADDNIGGTEDNLEETATNVRPKNHLKNVHKKPIEMQSDISLKDFEIWKRKVCRLLGPYWTQRRSTSDTNCNPPWIFII